MDISFDYLKSTAIDLAREYPWLPVHATCVDFTHSLPIPEQVPEGPRLLFFTGSSLGNFDPDEAGDFLNLVRNTVGDNGMLLIGVDTKKSESLLNAAYNDAAGMTAEFNLNLLHRMRKELDVDCNPENFEHRAFYNSEAGRIEMHLVSRYKQRLRVNGHCFNLETGESLHTENSYKYTPEEFISLASKCGLKKPDIGWIATGCSQYFFSKRAESNAGVFYSLCGVDQLSFPIIRMTWYSLTT